MDTAPRSTSEVEQVEADAPPVTMTARPALGHVRASGRWPRRRLLAAAGILVVLALGVQLVAGWDLATAPAWSALVLGVIVLASLALATFVPLPGHGVGLDVGCTPCAAAGGMLALAGSWLAASSAHDAGNASLGLALAGAALVRRLTEPVTCSA
jgi:hypothetical protein